MVNTRPPGWETSLREPDKIGRGCKMLIPR
nr:MAG TPA: hypothetical protein [Caudoviricetes sp.]